MSRAQAKALVKYLKGEMDGTLGWRLHKPTNRIVLVVDRNDETGKMKIAGWYDCALHLQKGYDKTIRDIRQRIFNEYFMHERSYNGKQGVQSEAVDRKKTERV